MRLAIRITTLVIAASMTAGTTTASAALLSVKTTGPGSVSVLPLGQTRANPCTAAGWCRYYYPDDATVTLYATPGDPPATFARWLSDCRPHGTAPTCRLSMDVHRNVLTRFGPVTLQLQEAVGGGTRVQTPALGTCGSGCLTFPYGSSVTVSAQPDDGWLPLQWTGACQGVPANLGCVLSLYDRTIVGPIFCQPEGDTCAAGMQQPLERYPTIHVAAVGPQGRPTNGAVKVLGTRCLGRKCDFKVRGKDVIVQAIGWRPGFYWTGGCRHRRRSCQLDTGKDAFGADAHLVGHFPS